MLTRTPPHAVDVGAPGRVPSAAMIVRHPTASPPSWASMSIRTALDDAALAASVHASGVAFASRAVGMLPPPPSHPATAPAAALAMQAAALQHHAPLRHMSYPQPGAVPPTMSAAPSWMIDLWRGGGRGGHAGGGGVLTLDAATPSTARASEWSVPSLPDTPYAASLPHEVPFHRRAGSATTPHWAPGTLGVSPPASSAFAMRHGSSILTAAAAMAAASSHPMPGRPAFWSPRVTAFAAADGVAPPTPRQPLPRSKSGPLAAPQDERAAAPPFSAGAMLYRSVAAAAALASFAHAAGHGGGHHHPRGKRSAPSAVVPHMPLPAMSPVDHPTALPPRGSSGIVEVRYVGEEEEREVEAAGPAMLPSPRGVKRPLPAGDMPAQAAKRAPDASSGAAPAFAAPTLADLEAVVAQRLQHLQTRQPQQAAHAASRGPASDGSLRSTADAVDRSRLQLMHSLHAALRVHMVGQPPREDADAPPVPRH